jgi:hypothetical protein
MKIAHPLALAAALVAGSVAPTAAEAARWTSTGSMKERTLFQSVLLDLDGADQPVDAWAVEPDGDWIIVSGTHVWHSAGMDETITTGVKLNIWFGRTIYEMDCRPDGLCAVVHSGGVLSNRTLPAAFTATANSWVTWGIEPTVVELTSGGWVMIAGSLAAYQGLTPDLRDAIVDRSKAKRTIRDLSIGFDGSWALLADQNPMWDSVPASLKSRLWTTSSTRQAVDRVLLGRNNDWIVYNGDDDFVVPDMASPIQALEYGLGPAGDETLWQRMSAAGVSGVGVAVIEGNKVVHARGYGRLRADQDRALLASSPWDVASLSKYVGALTVLVTPFSARAVDRGLAGLLVGMARHLDPELTPARSVTKVTAPDAAEIEARVIALLAERARAHRAGVDEALPERLAELARGLFQDWRAVVVSAQEQAANLSYSKWEEPRNFTPLITSAVETIGTFGEDESRRRFRAPTSMRDVEPEVHVWVDVPQIEGAR